MIPQDRLLLGLLAIAAALALAGLVLVKPRFRCELDPFGEAWGHRVG